VDNVILLADRRRTRSRGPQTRTRPSVFFAFDLASPATYLAAERVDRRFPGVRWLPALGDGLGAAWPACGRDRDRGRAATRARAAELRLPLVWPERPAVGLLAMRMAHYAVAEGNGVPFVLAASRLAYCGGYDLDDPEILAEAAAAAGLSIDASLRAARDRARDTDMEAAGRFLVARGADRLPVLGVGRLLFAGEERLAEAAAAARASAAPAVWAEHPGA
jgi:2-hydroxychromene-2-carboxylate isomerase